MKTWAKQLEDALPDAHDFVKEMIMEEFCPNGVFGGHAPKLSRSHDDDGKCLKCWDSCDSKCRYEVGDYDDQD